MKNWWRSVAKDWSLDPHHLKLLTLACEAWDRAAQARDVLAKEGAFFKDRFGSPKAHPATIVERDSRLAFCRLLREIGLEGAGPADSRPPRIGGRYL